MATTIDHLSVEHVIHVIQAFTDARGVSHEVGESGLITAIDADMRTTNVTITWKRGDKTEKIVIDLKNRAGPTLGRMKEFFELGEYQPAPPEGKRFVPHFGYVPLAPTIPEVGRSLITTDDRFSEAMERVWALAARQRFDEAEQQLMAIVNAEDARGYNDQRAAESLCACAKLHAFDEDRTVYTWLRDRGINLWYAWGSGATSGGEGMARSVDIRAAENDFKEIERKLAQPWPHS